MSALSVRPPFPAFAESDGQPLEDGYIWIGTVNLNPITNPIAAYWDAALTITAVQPIRTSGGYSVYQGTPATIYVNSDYSIQVQNKNGSVVYSAPAATERYSGVISASDVEWVSTGTGSQNRSVQSKLDDVIVNVFDFMTESQIADIRAGTSTNDTAQVQAAVDYAGSLDANVMIVFPPGTYEVTQISFFNASFGSKAFTVCIDGSNRAARLNFNGTNIQHCLFFDSEVGYSILGKFRIQGLHINSASGLGNGIKTLALSWGFTIDACQISGFDKNIWLSSAIFPRIVNSQITGATQYGIYCDVAITGNPGLDQESTTLRVERCWIASNNRGVLSYGQNANFTNNVFEGNTLYGLTGLGTKSVVMGNWFEAVTDKITGSAAFCTFTGNAGIMSSPASPLFDFDADSLSTNSANRNVFAGNGEGNAGYTIDRASQVIHSEVIIPFSFGTISLQNSNGFASASRPNPMAYFDGFCASSGSLVKVNDGDSGVVANSYLATKIGSPVFRVRNTDGAIFSNAGTIGSPADYAEMFEWEDGNPSAEDRVGLSVAIASEGKIKVAQSGDIVIGAVSGNPLVLGDSHWAHWKDKFIKDEFGRHVKEYVEYVEWLTTDAEGKPVGNVYAVDSIGDVVPPADAKRYIGQRDKLNPAHDPDAEYLPRSDRVEWDAVGLMGKLPLRKGQIVAQTWVKLKDVTSDVELWLVK